MTLLQRLRQYDGAQSQTTACYNGLRDEAADEIDRLHLSLTLAKKEMSGYIEVLAERDRLREALVGFADYLEQSKPSEAQLEVSPGYNNAVVSTLHWAANEARKLLKEAGQ